MGYTYDYALETFYKMVMSQHIYIYSKKTSANRISKGYSGLTGMLYNDKDVFPPSDNLLLADLGASSSQPV